MNLPHHSLVVRMRRLGTAINAIPIFKGGGQTGAEVGYLFIQGKPKPNFVFPVRQFFIRPEHCF